MLKTQTCLKTFTHNMIGRTNNTPIKRQTVLNAIGKSQQIKNA